MVSTYNAITRRPHIPRERVLRKIMANQGLDVPVDLEKRPSSSTHDLEPEPSDSETNTTCSDAEGEEESDLSDDETVCDSYPSYFRFLKRGSYI